MSYEIKKSSFVGLGDNEKGDMRHLQKTNLDVVHDALHHAM
jgi:hypothetical protein